MFQLSVCKYKTLTQLFKNLRFKKIVLIQLVCGCVTGSRNPLHDHYTHKVGHIHKSSFNNHMNSQ